jgi:hypothetical protein
VDEVVLEWDPERIGQYETVLPARIVSAGVQHLTLRSEKPFKLWYVRLTPQ